MAKAKKTKDYLRDYYENEDEIYHFERIKPKHKVITKKNSKTKGESLPEN